MIYAIGDIHGKRAMLQLALEHLRRELTADDYAIFLGDYIDRGRDSNGVIDDLLAFGAEYPQTVFLRGNHEEMFLWAYDDDQPENWLLNGGKETLDSYGTFFTPFTDGWKGFISETHVTFIKATILEHKARNHHFVHAGFTPPSQAPEKAAACSSVYTPEIRLWIREPFLSSEEDFGAIVVFGHTAQRQTFLPLVQPNKVGLDTAACLGGRLSVAAFNDDRDYRLGPDFLLFQVASKPDERVTQRQGGRIVRA